MRTLRSVHFLAAALALGVAGCGQAADPGKGGPVPAAPVEEPEAPKGEAIADPVLREARGQADTLLDGLLAGKFDNDPDLMPLARKLKGYRSSSITSQKMVREGAAEFRGTLIGPAARAYFKMTLVKQALGPWAIGTFSGPNAEKP